MIAPRHRNLLRRDRGRDSARARIARERSRVADRGASAIRRRRAGSRLAQSSSARAAPARTARSRRRGSSLGEVDAFAATSGPGLASSLMIGASLAKGLALGFEKPYLAINHLEGHLLSPFLRARRRTGEPNVSLIVSGGHTLLVEVSGVGRLPHPRPHSRRRRRRSLRQSGEDARARIIRAARRSSAARATAIRRGSISAQHARLRRRQLQF